MSGQVGAFLSGFYSLIPEALLEAFDENEVELLLCGMPDVPFADFKVKLQPRHCVSASRLP